MRLQHVLLAAGDYGNFRRSLHSSSMKPYGGHNFAASEISAISIIDQTTFPSAVQFRLARANHHHKQLQLRGALDTCPPSTRSTLRLEVNHNHSVMLSHSRHLRRRISPAMPSVTQIAALSITTTPCLWQVGKYCNTCRPRADNWQMTAAGCSHFNWSQWLHLTADLQTFGLILAAH